MSQFRIGKKSLQTKLSEGAEMGTKGRHQVIQVCLDLLDRALA
jgi:hypothetical protein